MKAMWTMMAGSLLTLVTFGAGFICGGLLVYDVEKYGASKDKETKEAKA